MPGGYINSRGPTAPQGSTGQSVDKQEKQTLRQLTFKRKLTKIISG